MNTPLLHRWLLAGEWRQHPLRMLVAILAIAVGVALGYAIDLVNSAAALEFSASLQSLSGQSDLQVKGGSGYFDEEIYPLLARQNSIENAYPVLEINATVSDDGSAGVITNASATASATSSATASANLDALPTQRKTLKILGIDILRAGRADLIGRPLASSKQTGQGDPGFNDSFADDTIFLSSAAQVWLQLFPGQHITLNGQRLRIAGDVANARSGQRIAVMDIGGAQWRFKHLGKLSRIELRLKPQFERDQVQKELQALLLSQGRHGQFSVTQIEQQEQQAANMTRAYRVNLNLLALIALATGAFLVFTNQALSVIRRRSQFALLRVLGFTRNQLLTQILLEGALTGGAGALLGVALGYALAYYGLQSFGADLGAGYFAAVTPRIHFAPLRALFFLSLGAGVALCGALAPAWQAQQLPASASLKAGDAALGQLASPWPGLAALALALVFSQLPPVAELPLFAYAATALLLLGGIALMPQLCARLFARLLARQRPHALHTLAFSRLANNPSQAGIALGGMLASFSLMVAMAIMVTSFRFSLDQWLQQILPADLYVRSIGESLTLEQQQAVQAVKGIARLDWQRGQQLSLNPTRPPVALLARKPPEGRIISASLNQTPGPGQIPVWISEAMPDLYGHALGQVIRLPLAGKFQNCLVVGIWRDYANQSGSIVMARRDYIAISGDQTASDGAIWLAGGANNASVSEAIKALPFAAQLQLAEPGLLRSMSLRIFDRSFAITYLLEAVAILIGLFGVATSFSAQTLARKREFGMLRHLGYGRAQVLQLLALEGGWLGLLGVGGGFVLGYAISLILVFVVNPQSFHWHMALAVPWNLLGGTALVLWLAAGATALLAGRHALADDALRAVKEDW